MPEYLAAVPNDPEDGAPLRFKRQPDGVIVYWIGPDGTDDGGKLNRRNNLVSGANARQNYASRSSHSRFLRVLRASAMIAIVRFAPLRV